MQNKQPNVVVAQMKPRERREWHGTAKKKTDTKRLLRNISFSAAVVLCLGAALITSMRNGQTLSAVMSHVTTDFEYDDTLGRLQFVSNILPESAMVFLTDTGETLSVWQPTDAEIEHVWSEAEPWLEYTGAEEICVCQDGEIMTVVQNREGEYTVRVRHENGYESLYSGLIEVRLAESDQVKAGETLGLASNVTGFELRKDGLSVLPVFGSL